MQRQTTDFWLQSLSSLLPCKQHSVHLKDTLQGSLVLTQTTAYNTDARSCKHTLSIPNTHSLFNMPLHLRLGPLRSSSFFGISPSYQLHQRHAQLLNKVTGSGTFQQLVKQLQNKNHTNNSEFCSCLLLLTTRWLHTFFRSPFRFFFSFLAKLPA